MYPIWNDDRIIGTAKVEERGLYRHIACACKPQIPGRYHIRIVTREQTLDLGLCVPEAGDFVLRTSIPAKNIPQGELRFLLIQMEVCRDWIPLQDHQPFLHLYKLKTARLVRQNGQYFVNLSADPDLRDSGQNPEYRCK